MTKIAIITGSSGLIGSAAVEFLSSKFDKIIGVDNDLRSYFFGKQGSTHWNTMRLKEKYGNFEHASIDIRNLEALEAIFRKEAKNIKLIIHTAAQPSHDWAMKEPMTDFSVNATGTLNLLELTRLHSPGAVFIFTSTNKVYGDTPNKLPLVELDTRFEIHESHPYSKIGIDELMSIDQSTHSVFGASKIAADIMVQEYGRYFGMNTGIFRGGCLTGPNHSGAQLHGFLSYLMNCAISETEYTIFGYKGKQVRDNIHAHDLINMFWHFYLSPKQGEVYNVGGGQYANCSMIEAIKKCEDISGNKMNVSYSSISRKGDHIWYISDVSKFRKDYPNWTWKYNIDEILMEIHEGLHTRL